MNKFRNVSMIKGAIIILVVSQLLTLFLAIASFDDVYRESLISEFQVVTGEIKEEIERGINLGRPIDRFTGLEDILKRGLYRKENLSNMFVTSVEGRVLGATQQEAESTILDIGHVDNLDIYKDNQYNIIEYKNHYYIVVPLLHNDDNLVGFLISQFNKNIITERIVEILLNNLVYFVWILIGAACLIVVFLTLIDNFSSEKDNNLKRFFNIERKKILAILAVLLIAQSYYTYLNYNYFKSAYTEVIESKISSLSWNMKENIETLMDLGLSIDSLKNMENVLGISIADFKECKDVFVTDKEGEILYRADYKGSRSIVEGNLLEEDRQSDFFKIKDEFKEYINEIRDSDGILKGYLVYIPDLKLQESQLSDMLQDSVTIILVSLLFAFEMLMFLTLIARRKRALIDGSDEKEFDDDSGFKIIRLAAFTFFLGDLFSMSFLPLFTKNLYSENPVNLLGLSQEAIVSLPISAYMVGVTIIIPVVGFISKKISVKNMFYACISISIIGSLFSALSVNVPMLIVFRFLAGIGYGGTIINSIDFIIQNTREKYRATGFGNWSAGYAAASICALPISSVIVSKFGYRVGLMLSVATGIAFAIIVYHYVKDKKRPVDDIDDTRNFKESLIDLFVIFKDRNIALCLFLSSIPLQICLVGVYQFFFPLYMNSINISQGNIGRLMSIFGIISLMTPLVAKISDKINNNKIFLICGNMIIGASFLLYLTGGSVLIVAISIAAIGLGSTFVDAVREAYLISIDKSREIGETKMISIYCTYEKFATVLAPVFIGMLMASFNPTMVIAYMGIVLIFCILMFAVFTHGKTSKVNKEESREA
ncbi:MFS transporter [Herbivorax sp. ANBcel31]|uniref:MFS transporter n=1 Tax=Herbivorax sp. ANBcel31 TaxID=3069754 RepID=UPI0027AEA8DA|nr:MFS transporter [Herbivorax sp. ANBcel31]MDQ2085370.1 MFS transporter [Herbivorax sp. ANBcel31]